VAIGPLAEEDVDDGTGLLVREDDLVLLKDDGDWEGEITGILWEYKAECEREDDGIGIREVSDGIADCKEPDIRSSWKNEVAWLYVVPLTKLTEVKFI